jgi:hypothetical protein
LDTANYNLDVATSSQSTLEIAFNDAEEALGDAEDA